MVYLRVQQNQGQMVWLLFGKKYESICENNHIYSGIGGVYHMSKQQKKWGIVILIVFAVLVLFTIKTYGVAEQITASMLESPNSDENKQDIARIVLNDTGRNTAFSPDEVVEIKVYTGDLLGNGQQQAVIAVSFGLKNTVLAVYTKDKNTENYTYIDDVGDFFDVRDVLFLPLSGSGSNIMVVREYANQNIGAYERSSFLKGYIWDDKNQMFQNVLSVPEGIEVTWNGSWDTSGEKRWQKIEERSEFVFNENFENDPTLKFTQYQAYKISESTDKDNIPDESTFRTAKNRIINQTYYWSDEWKRFILSEKKDKATGEKVAVIEDYSASPYVLVEEYSNMANNVVIQRPNGTIETVPTNTLWELDGTEAKSTFFAYE